MTVHTSQTNQLTSARKRTQIQEDAAPPNVLTAPHIAGASKVGPGVEVEPLLLPKRHQVLKELLILYIIHTALTAAQGWTINTINPIPCLYGMWKQSLLITERENAAKERKLIHISKIIIIAYYSLIVYYITSSTPYAYIISLHTLLQTIT